MPPTGVQIVSAIQEDLLCPACNYSLCGLSGEVVRCPECGNLINIASLIASQWRGPWYRAPLYNTLAWPLAWAFLSSLSILAGLIFTFTKETPPEWLLWTGVALVVGGWVLVMIIVRVKFGEAEGVWLSLLLHLVLPAYVLGGVGFVGMLVKSYIDFTTRRWLLLYDLVYLTLCIGLIMFGRWIERLVAQRCIRRHLRVKAAAATMQA